MICSILAVSSNGCIGNSRNPDSLPWPRLSKDLKWFQNNTKNQVVIMGRKSWDSLKEHAPLVNRKNIVISRSQRYFEGAEKVIAGDINDNILRLSNEYNEKIFITGGAEIYMMTADIVDELYLTRVHDDYDGDAFVDTGALIGNRKLSYNEHIEATETTPAFDLQIWK